MQQHQCPVLLTNARRLLNRLCKFPLILKKKIDINFSIIGYRDHEMSKSNITINLKKLCG